MPTISQFLGITIRMYYRDHEEAHFHAFYGDAEASIRLRDLAVVAGGDEVATATEPPAFGSLAWERAWKGPRSTVSGHEP